MLGHAMINLTDEDQVELLFSAVAGAVFGLVIGYLVGSQGFGLLIWAIAFAVIVTGMVYSLRAIR
jgi:type IV secretory pathway TrbD component